MTRVSSETDARRSALTEREGGGEREGGREREREEGREEGKKGDSKNQYTTLNIYQSHF